MNRGQELMVIISWLHIQLESANAELSQIEKKCKHENRVRICNSDVTKCPDCGHTGFD